MFWIPGRLHAHSGLRYCASGRWLWIILLRRPMNPTRSDLKLVRYGIVAMLFIVAGAGPPLFALRRPTELIYDEQSRAPKFAIWCFRYGGVTRANLVTTSVCPTKQMIAQTIADDCEGTADDLGSEDLYAFTLIQGQRCNYLGYAVATEAALTATTARYIAKGYRYHGPVNWLMQMLFVLGFVGPIQMTAGITVTFATISTIDGCGHAQPRRESLRTACIDQLKAATRLQE